MTDRRTLQENGAALRRQLIGETERPLPQGFAALMDEVVYGGIWDRPGLPRPDRAICTIAALSAHERLVPLRREIGVGLDLGLTPAAVAETIVQTGLYTGFAAVAGCYAVAAEVFAARGLPEPEEAPDARSLEDLSDDGANLMARLHGDRARQGYAAPDNPVTGALYPAAIRYGYGVLWFRPGLDTRRRALVAVAAFTALRMEGQVRKFGQSAINAGLTREEVVEAVIQTAPYSGFPGALNALAGLSEVLG